MLVGARLPVVVPGMVNAAPVKVALVPTTTPLEPEMESVMTVPAGAEPAVLLKDQRFTMAAWLERPTRAKARYTRRVRTVFKRFTFNRDRSLVKSGLVTN